MYIYIYIYSCIKRKISVVLCMEAESSASAKHEVAVRALLCDEMMAKKSSAICVVSLLLGSLGVKVLCASRQD